MHLDSVRIDAVFADWQGENVPGGVIGIVHQGELVYSAAYGMADLERPTPLTPASVFDVASIGKQFTAFCIALLADEAKLSLADELQQYFPHLPNYGVPITLQQLICHTSGLPDYLELMDIAGWRLEHDYVPAQVFRLLQAHPQLNNAPGTRFLYSNTGYFLLAEIVRQVTGQSLSEFASKRIFQPLGMTQTQFAEDTAQIIPQRALGFAPSATGFVLSQSLMSLVGDGKLLTNLYDLARWDANWIENRLGGGADLLARLLALGQLKDGTPLDYAFGWQAYRYRGLQGWRHGGTWFGYKSEFMRFPDAQVSVICLANRRDAYPAERCRRVLDSLLEERLSPRPIVPSPQPAPPDALQAHLGRYLDLDGRITWRMLWEEGRLWMVHYSWARFGLHEQAPNDYISVIGPVTMTLRLVQDIWHLTLEGFAPSRLRRLPEPPSLDLAIYAGTYVHDELGTIHQLVMGTEGLEALVGDSAQALPLEYIAPDVLVAPNTFYYAFERNAVGQISGIMLSSERVHDVRLRRLNDIKQK